MLQWRNIRERKDRNSQEIVNALRAAHNVAAQRKLRNVKLAVAHHPPEDLFRLKRQVVELNALRAHLARAQGGRAVVVSTAESEVKVIRGSPNLRTYGTDGTSATVRHMSLMSLPSLMSFLLSGPSRRWPLLQERRHTFFEVFAHIAGKDDVLAATGAAVLGEAADGFLGSADGERAFSAMSVATSRTRASI